MVGYIALGLVIGFIITFLIYTVEYFVELWLFGRDLELKFTNELSPSKDKNENTCVYCGASIPEGRLVCKHCEDSILKK